jgi:hypothetical protein
MRCYCRAETQKDDCWPMRRNQGRRLIPVAHVLLSPGIDADRSDLPARSDHTQAIEKVQSSGSITYLILRTCRRNIPHIALHRWRFRKLFFPPQRTQRALRNPLRRMPIATEILTTSRNIVPKNRTIEDLEAGLRLVPRNIMTGLENAREGQ